MLVKCIKNNFSQFEDGPIKDLFKDLPNLNSYNSDDLVIGRLYTVYGINFDFHGNKFPFYQLCSDDYLVYPKPNAAVFFEIIDPRPSRYWNLAIKGINARESGYFLPEWIQEDCFQLNLIDGEAREEGIFTKYCRLMDKEYKRLDIGDEVVLNQNIPTECLLSGTRGVVKNVIEQPEVLYEVEFYDLDGNLIAYPTVTTEVLDF